MTTPTKAELERAVVEVPCERCTGTGWACGGGDARLDLAIDAAIAKGEK